MYDFMCWHDVSVRQAREMLVLTLRGFPSVNALAPSWMRSPSYGVEVCTTVWLAVVGGMSSHRLRPSSVTPAV